MDWNLKLSELSEAYIENFLDYLSKERNYSEHTVSAYNTDLSQFLDFLSNYMTEGSYHFSSIDKKVIKKFIVYLNDKSLSPKTIKRKIATLKSFFRYLLKNHLIESNPASTTLAPKSKKDLPRFLQKEVLTKVLSLSEKDDWLIRRDCTILEVLYSTGIRLSELISLDITDVVFDGSNKKRDGGTIKVLGKGGKHRTIPFGEKVTEALGNYLKERVLYVKKEFHDGPLFISKRGQRISPRTVQLRLKKLFRSVSSGSGFTPHLMRHTFATHLINNGADIRAIKELLGHSSLSTTQIYTHLNEKEMKKIFDQAHPHA